MEHCFEKEAELIQGHWTRGFAMLKFQGNMSEDKTDKVSVALRVL